MKLKTQIYHELVTALGEYGVSYDTVKKWYCGRHSSHGALTIATIQENIKNVYDLVLQDVRMAIWWIVEHICL